MNYLYLSFSFYLSNNTTIVIFGFNQSYQSRCFSCSCSLSIITIIIDYFMIIISSSLLIIIIIIVNVQTFERKRQIDLQIGFVLIQFNSIRVACNCSFSCGLVNKTHIQKNNNTHSLTILLSSLLVRLFCSGYNKKSII